MKKRITTASLSLTLMIYLLASLSGCSVLRVQAVDLMADVKPNAIDKTVDLLGDDSGAIADLEVNLFKNCVSPDKNTLISPLSVISALGMTANGAKGETLEQMKSLLGLPPDKLNEYLHTYLKNISSDKNCKLDFANSIWIKNDENLSVNTDFLQLNANYYGAAVYKANFDHTTVNDINSWVDYKTQSMIKNILSDIPPNAVMYLINALAFDGKWLEEYESADINEDIFTTESGEERKVKMLSSEEYLYLDDSDAVGFIKYYKGGKYAFAALLPSEGLSISDYVSSLSGKGIMNTLKNAEGVLVHAFIPKFEADYSIEMKDVLKSMGMTNAFEPQVADFTNMATYEKGKIYINSVVHKTYISLDEKGTKAAAATIMEMGTKTAAPNPQMETKTIRLDRPFVYMIIDCNTYLPVFIGTTMDIGE